MLYLSYERFIHWLPFFIIGVGVYYIASLVFRRYRRKFILQGSLYYRIADIIVPLNFLVIVSFDLYFLYYGKSILLLAPSVTVLSISLAAVSYVVGLLDTSSIFSVHLMSSSNRMWGFITVLAITVPVVAALGTAMVLKAVPLLTTMPLMAMAFGIMGSIALPNRRFRPLSILVLPFLVIILSISYIVYILTFFR